MEAAGEIFAEEGFKRATIRKICSRAGVNVASVNYHFGDKEGLYLSVLRHYRDKAYRDYPANPGPNEGDAPEVRLQAFVRSFMFRILGQGSPSWFGKLFAREFIEPTRALDVVIEESIRPSFNELMKIVSELISGTADERILRLCTASIVGQCLYYRNAREVIRRIIGKESFSSQEIEGIARHIVEFSVNAIQSSYGNLGPACGLQNPGVWNGK
jgi:TetR/AcrR family transcriptional regulator, regulator of cefoperazone and chloramphenicol sensitivity